MSSRSVDHEESDSLDVLEILSRQRWLIIFLCVSGLAAGIAYALYTPVWYESNASILINQRSAGLSGDTTGQSIVDEDILANHIELIQSRMIVGEALEQNDLLDLASVTAQLDESKPEFDAVDYVIEQLEVVKGGEGSAKGARSLSVTLTHTDPEDAQLLLTSVMKRYEQFIIAQVEQLMGQANEMVNQAKQEVESELLAAEQEHLKSRQNAPLFFQGEGSSNVYQDRYRRLQEELLDIDIKESTVRTRLQRVEATLEEMDNSGDAFDHLDKLALIDSESLERLGVFAGLQMNAADSPEFKAAMPAKMEEARTQITHLLQLNSEKQRLSSVFGAAHPKVQELESEITLVKQFLQDKQDLTSPTSAFGDSSLSPEGLLKAYVGFLQHDLAALAERRKELTFLAADSETKAKELIEYELTDMILQKKISRQEALFDGIVQQLRELDTASGLSGYLYEFLEVPRLGVKSWPKLPLCALGGLMLGLFGGLVLAVANDVRDGRFRSAAELDEAIGLPSLGRVGKLNSIKQGISGLVAAELSPDAEAFRLGRTVLLPDIRRGDLRTIGFTSPMQSDGKSTVTSNFAVSFSQVGLRVLVIDADLRRPSAHRFFSVDKADGLCDVLERRLNFDDAVKETRADNVFVMTAGSASSMPAELLQAEALDQVLVTAREQYDLVLVDLPPVLAVSDPVVVMPRLDGGILVVKVASVRRDEVINTLRRIESSGGNFVGCMLNAFGAGKKFDADGGYYGYYQSDYTRSASTQPRTVRAGAPNSPIGASVEGVNGKPPQA
ncbi:polysaccharide biosynthesis tyrosine autokinase [Aporhodopirellula aestuarii]|uniref:non-specific protein-tyrosine kinase n=1 Tax=Aporhodopirellula aestuarii TaxID=2950107 RepID=A0ABT0UAD2_9BACT|nr:polysaccharide biosynthesis tyrosine autokinase [Aporhodopirellula aestuarii]MCM2373860.1 polysaccharide biosynthesis tyrosine autokinase [Aporhodopirellula aestuarii]